MQESGSVTLPANFRKKYDLQPDDEIVFPETHDGLLIDPRETLINKLLKELGDDLRDQDISLDDLMTSGYELRTKLLKKHYGIDSDT